VSKKQLPATNEEAWIDVPSQAALESMSEDRLGEVARERHAEARRIAERDVLPHAIVAGLCLREAKSRVRARGESWARWLESHWHMHEWSARQFMGAAETYLSLVDSCGAAPRNPAGVMETMAQAMKAIGCAELAKPGASKPRERPQPEEAEFTVAPAGSNTPVPAYAPAPACQPVIDHDELDRLDAEEAAEQAELDAAGIYVPRPAAQADPEEDPEPEPEPEPAPQPDPTEELRQRLEEVPTDTKALRLLLWGHSEIPDLRGNLVDGVSLEQLAHESAEAIWRQLDQCLSAPRPADVSPMTWLPPSAKRSLTAIRDALAPVVDLAAAAVRDRHGDSGIASAKRERREIEARLRAERAAREEAAS
jgi:hypothetical protein